MPTSMSLPDRGAPAWLHEKVYTPRRQRTLDRVRQAIEALIAAAEPVSLAAIASKAKALDSAGRGISTSAILGNADARACYEQHRRWRRVRPLRPTMRPERADTVPPRITARRDVARARGRYLRWSKARLVERLLAVEHAYAEQEERWLRVNDDLLTWQLRAEHHGAQPAIEAPQAPELDTPTRPAMPYHSLAGAQQ